MASDGVGSISLPLRDRMSPGPPSPALGAVPSRAGGNPLSTKLTSVLSTSYVDSEFREALALLDERGVSNSAETRRRLRLDVQKEVIDSNGQIIAEFGRVADQLRRIGATIDKLNQSYEEMKRHVTAAHEATSSTLDEAGSLMAQRRNVETRQQLLRAFRERFVLTEDETAALTLTAEPVDDRFFAALAKAKRVRKDCEVLLGFEDQTLGLDLMERTSKHLNAAFQKLYRWVQREFRTLNLENPQINSPVRRALRVLAERPSLFQSCLDFFADAREQILSDAFHLALTGTAPASGAKDHSVKPIELAAHDPLRYVGDMLAWTHSATVSEREALEVLFVSDGHEIARGLLEGRENEPWQLTMADPDADEPLEFDALKALGDLVDRDVSGAARILRQRVEQVIQTNEDTILAYKLANLLNFYQITFAKLMGGGGPGTNASSSSSSGNGSATGTGAQPQQSVLLEAIANLETEALRQFRALMRDYIATLQGEFQHPPADLGPPDFLQDALKQLSAIMGTYETSLASATSASGDDREADFQPVMAESFAPFISGCEHMAKSLRGAAHPGDSGTATDDDAAATASQPPPTTIPADAIFLINCLLAAAAVIEPFDFGRRRAARLRSQVVEHAARLTEAQYGFFRTESGLEPIFAALAPFLPASSPSSPSSSTDEPLAPRLRALPALRPEALAAAAAALDDFLPSAVLDATENVQQVQDAGLARAVTEEAAARFCADFERVEALFARADEEEEEEKEREGEEEEGEKGPLPPFRSLFPRTAGEIRVLLS